ncbi:M3 family metallopeptidase [Bartonella krasnovii]|uniref:M3 family metallopeptidase n=1 Tax=Bartonella krasnovii TaxID=2267275 RepID=A0ABY3VY10_9HYPH|nr:M3 family metallopeptidase [Bartonella krasnovii]UNF29261.1 M3 family metallopeptidase [Bartonella krasnovii]UNF35618.1 M3 family metallopeptidase [Bartonella krasnovii]UNF38932.1 M3 family metallopeptidase [Bartonella krasnovii]UNF50470.1 M3 family metallopeptidase [Bartonella krasnovii]UNF52177.1 M3 family metallopeptidase [Bartonella krasnovii]
MTKSAVLDWKGFSGLPDFSSIRDEDFKPAFEQALQEAEEELEAIAMVQETPTLENFLQSFELCGKALDRVCSIFFLRASAHTNALIQQLEQEFVVKLSRYSSKMMMDERIFAKIDALYQQSQQGIFESETTRVLELWWKKFVYHGAKLDDKAQKRLAEINERLAFLNTTFGQNVLNDEAEWILFLKQTDLSGLPEDLIASMKEIACERGHEEAYALTLARSIVEPFLKFSDRRDLREVAFQAWAKRGENNNKNDNRSLILEIVALRDEQAKLLGYKSFADLKLDNTMAKSVDSVMDLLMPVWKRARTKASAEQIELQNFANNLGSNESLAAWDWRYYAEKLRTEKLSFDSAEIKYYFQLDRMIKAAFGVAEKLFGITFEEKNTVALWHPDARLWEVKKSDGSLLGHFIGDYFARSSKRSGAWMSQLRSQHKLDGGQKPIIYNICNFAKPSKGEVALLSLDDARTLFHEFGHALHGLLSDVTWPSVAGTSVSRDFVELPSQLYEHWLTVPEILKSYAIHVRTGHPMSQELIDKVVAAQTFNAGFSAVEFISSALVDIAFHQGETVTDPTIFEHKELEKLQMPDTIIMRHRPSHFMHVFAGDGYAAGYYSYMWSEVLDADAFQAFEETGDAFNSELADLLKRFIYSAGGSRDPEELYKAFRGRMPLPEAMMNKRGL